MIGRALAVALVFAGCGADEVVTSGAAASAERVPQAAPETRGPSYVAVVEASQAATLSTEFATRIVRFPASVGDAVRKGDVIAVLDSGALEKELVMAEASYQSARAARSKASLEAQEAARQAGVTKRLYREDVVSKEELVQSRFAVKRARASLAEASAAAKSHQANVDRTRQQLADASVRAPFDGVVAQTFARPGESVKAGGRVARVIAPADLVVRFGLPLADHDRVELGTRVQFMADTGDLGQTLTAVVREVSPELDPAVQIAIVEASVEPGKGAGIAAGTVGRVTPLAAVASK